MSLAEPIEKVKHILNSMMGKLTGGDKRRAAGKVAVEYGTGGQTFAAEAFGMGRNTVRKGMSEVKTGEEIEDKYSLRGRKKTTEKLPELESHIRAILDSQSQADPKFQTDRLYTNLSIEEVRRQLIKQYGYTDESLPTARTLNTIVNEKGYTVRTVKKTIPKDVVPQTWDIFDNLDKVHEAAANDDTVVRLSIDTKDRVKVGEYSRGGASRVQVYANDHDFGDEFIVPFGIMNVKEKTTSIYLSETKATADFMVDRLEEYWIENGHSGTGKTLLLNADNGPENSSRRTQFIKRMIQFSIDNNTEVQLAYYPPYFSKFNPIERVWGVLEQHWDGALLDSKETIERYIETTTYDKKRLTAKIIDKVYETGVKVSAKTMRIYEQALERAAGLEKWFVRISPQKCMETLAFTVCFY